MKYIDYVIIFLNIFVVYPNCYYGLGTFLYIAYHFIRFESISDHNQPSI